ncbi:MAG TPA: hypothetical protein VFM59_07315, partial [Salinimicrobium sp.]|nr:hypothetical protein [Salinimicrobium sp.]
MKNENTAEENVFMKLPVEVEYQVLNEILKQKFQGKVLSKGMDDGTSSDQAKIEEIFLQPHTIDGFELSLRLKLRLLTSFFQNKTVEMLIHISPQFHFESQEISVQKYEIDGLNNGWIINNLLESLINSFLYNKLKNKMKFRLQPLLQSKISDLNTKLLSGLEVKNGIFLYGEIQDLTVSKILFEEEA